MPGCVDCHKQQPILTSLIRGEMKMGVALCDKCRDKELKKQTTERK